ncbi:MAG: hypothetical protein WB679_10685 [Terracidiphilus sp.]
MSNNIVRQLTPEEQELLCKRKELSILQAELAERELFLANLQGELGAFEGRYLREIGTLYAELDDWNAKIAEFAAAADGSEEAKSAAAEARGRADESNATAHGNAAKSADFSPSPYLKKLFREVVRQIHPDNAADEEDRAERNRLMTDANLAYRRGDEDALLRIMDEYRNSPEAVKGAGAMADLQRILRQIERIVKRIAQIDSEVAALNNSEIALLMATVKTGAAKGRDLFAKMKKDLQSRIDLSQREFDDLLSNRGAR